MIGPVGAEVTENKGSILRDGRGGTGPEVLVSQWRLKT